MIKIRELINLNPADLERIASGYSSNTKYKVVVESSEEQVSINLQLVKLKKPYIKKFDHFDHQLIERYNSFLKDNYSFGAYDGNFLIGLALAEPHLWNQTLWMNEFHVAETYRHQGIGKQLMEYVIKKAQEEKLRAIVCETQNTNTSAIRFYQSLGFKIEGVDISYYSNNDYPDGEIALFLKRRLV